MLRFLFPRLTAEPERGASLFAWVTTEARATHWYLDGAVEDNLDGRFAVLATIAALVSLRLEQAGDSGAAASVALTERFIEVMEAEHREMGLGDPKLGRTVRKLVGSLARRIELWRPAVGDGDWTEATRHSVYGEGTPPAEALAHSARRLRDLWRQLEAARDSAVAVGEIA
jgi:cytochrome b pre-mRNA-processing protein 3